VALARIFACSVPITCTSLQGKGPVTIMAAWKIQKAWEPNASGQGGRGRGDAEVEGAE
jgi:hypothetical protein